MRFSLKALFAACLVASLTAYNFWWSRPETRVLTISMDDNIDLNGMIVDAAIIDEYSTSLGNSGHITYSVHLAKSGLSSLTKQIENLNGGFARDPNGIML